MKFELLLLIKSMHERVLKYARKKLTKLIQEKIGLKKKQQWAIVHSTEGIDNDQASTTIGLKLIIMKLEESERNGTHISIIRNVTNDGMQLLRNNSNSTLASEEVLDRVSFYHEMEDIGVTAV